MNLLSQLGVADWARGFKPVNCAAEPCRRWLTERQLQVSRVGVTFDQSWYCSYSCALSRIEGRLQMLLTPRSLRRVMQTRPSFSLTLVRRGQLTDQQYKDTIEYVRATDYEFGEAAVRLGFVTASDVTESRAVHWACPLFAYSPGLNYSTVHIPSPLRLRHSMVPLHHLPNSNRLFVGFQYGVEYATLFAIEQITGCTTQPCLIAPHAFAKVHSELTDCRAVEERYVEGVGSVREVTQLICQAGRAMDAESVAIARCDKMLWSRLTGRIKTTDLLFMLT